MVLIQFYIISGKATSLLYHSKAGYCQGIKLYYYAVIILLCNERTHTHTHTHRRKDL